MEHVKVFFKKGIKVQELRKQSGNRTQKTVTFFSDDWLTNSTTLEVYIDIDGVPPTPFF
ncbi:MAG TPA: hypothetical protein VM935_14015 [Chitinophagaceae bacterium]|nr:hypothetical protein [Chitinophagaceae bacterium]